MTDFLAQLPQPSPRRLALHVTPAAERALRDKHPWLFDQAIQKQSAEGQAGDLAVIYDRKNRFLAVGLYDPHSPIRVKVLQHGTPAQIDTVWFHEKLRAAAAIRAPLLETETTGYRLVHGENDGLPGLVIDRYADTLVIKLYTTAWFAHLRVVLAALESVQPVGRWVLRLSRDVQTRETYGLHDGQVLRGDVPSEALQFSENGLHFAADVISGHKTGFFFDQRENRAQVGALSAGREVLDVFAYSGGFSVYAAAGGAKSVLSVDVSAPALEAAQQNMLLNGEHPRVAQTRHLVMIADAFELLHKMADRKREFDLVIVDPPSFAKSAAEVPRALAAYGDLARSAVQLVRSGGVLVMSSCSSRVSADDFFRTVHAAARKMNRPLRELRRSFHALDHPISFPEGAYLKGLFAEVVE